MNNTKRIAYSAVCSAISVVCIWLTNILPLGVALLAGVSLGIFIAFDRLGIVYGLLTCVVSFSLSFLITGFNGAFIFSAILFAPYGILAFIIKSLHYASVKTALIRVAIVLAFSQLALMGLWFLADKLVIINLTHVASKIGGYVVVALIFAVIAVAFDFLFKEVSIRVRKLIK